jgi:hypothetical protein
LDQRLGDAELIDAVADGLQGLGDRRLLDTFGFAARKSTPSLIP